MYYFYSAPIKKTLWLYQITHLHVNYIHIPFNCIARWQNIDGTLCLSWRQRATVIIPQVHKYVLYINGYLLIFCEKCTLLPERKIRRLLKPWDSMSED